MDSTLPMRTAILPRHSLTYDHRPCVLLRTSWRWSAYVLASAVKGRVCHSILPRKFRTCYYFQRSQIPKYAVAGQEIHQ